MTLWTFARASIVVLTMCAVSAPLAPADQFYAGKTLRITTHNAPGGTFDAYVRVLARHVGKHMPGNPTTIVQNQIGAGGVTAVNHVAKIAPQDGTSMTLVSPGLLTHEVTGQPGLEVSLAKLKWIGNFTKANQLHVTSPQSDVKTLDDAKIKVARIGATGTGGASAQLPWAYNALLGTKFKVIAGYKGGADFDIAIERGELDGRSVTFLPSYLARLPPEVRPKVNVIIQLGLEKDPALPDVPLLLDLVKGDAKKEAVARFLSLALSSINRPMATGPGVPDDRVRILRRAFDATMKDPEFLADSEKLVLEIDPMNGEVTQAAVEEILSFPADVVEMIKAVMAQPK